jgi:hypothetical protein
MKTLSVLFLLFALCSVVHAQGQRVLVLDFELKDMTLLPNHPEELTRTASIKPLLITELNKAGFTTLTVDTNTQQAANMGVGYLFDHADVAAQLGQSVVADYVVVGRLHKPSFLFAYLLANIVNVKTGTLMDSLSVESKGNEKKLTGKAVEALADKIAVSLH